MSGLKDLQDGTHSELVTECAEFLMNPPKGATLPPLGLEILSRLVYMTLYAGDLEDKVGVLERSLDGYSVDMAVELERHDHILSDSRALREELREAKEECRRLKEDVGYLKKECDSRSLTIESEKQLRKSERETVTKNFSAELAAVRARVKMSDDAANAAIMAKDESERQRDLMRGELAHANQCLAMIAPLAEVGVKSSHPFNVSHSALMAIEECRRRKMWLTRETG